MSTTLNKNVLESTGRNARSMTRKQSSETLGTQISQVIEQSDPIEAVRQLVQQMVGQRLPSERALAARLNISRPHLRSILARLQKEGLVEARPKSGTYVVDDSTQRLHRIVLLIDADLKLNDDPFILSFVDSLQRSVQAIGARCLIERTVRDGQRPALEDGVLTLGLAGHALIMDQRPDDPPMVGLLLDASARPHRRASLIQLEDMEAGRTAGRRLLERGCHEIVFLGRRDIPASSERLAGVEEIVTEAGAHLRFVDCHLNYGAGLRLGRDIDLPRSEHPIGIVATNDWMALGFRTGLRDRDVALSREVRIVSFDGLPVTADPLLGIDSLAVPINEIAADAVAELQRLHRSQAATGRTIRYPLL